jgi:hypothetical protein
VMQRVVQPSTPASARSLFPSPASMPPAGTPGHNEVEQIIKPTTGVVVCPSVQLGLDPRSPAAEPASRLGTARRYSPATSRHPSPNTADTLPSFALVPAFPASDYYGAPPRPKTVSRRRRLPATGPNVPGEGGSRDGSHVHHEPFDGIGAQLFPCSLATGTP